MRPWMVGGGKEDDARRMRFNGATALRPWMVGAPAPGLGRRQASMGPRPCGRGWRRADADRARAVMLQWGHGLAAVDGQ